MLLIKNGNLITMAGMYEQTGDILIDDGKIVKVGQVGEVPEDCQVIDAAGRTVTPGLVDAHCHAGLWGTACREEMDGNEYTEPVLPGLRGLDAINPEDATFDAALRQGITTVVTGPGSSNIVGGTFLAIKTAGEDMESRLICPELAMKMALGENPKMTFGNRGKAPRTRMMSAALMREELFKAKEYYENYKLHGQEPDFPFDFHLHSLMRVFEGMRVKIHAHQADDIQTAVRVANEFGLHYSIEHCTEGHMIVDALKRHNVRCTIGPYLWQPYKQELWNMKMENPAILANAGVPISLTADTGSQTAYLPATLGLLMRRGLSEQSAFEGITINPARTLQLGDRVGSLEEGKDADIAIFDGHPFSSLSACRMTIIDGKIVHDTLTK